ncbi:MAG: sulfotransferase [Actinomycetota bacterium]|nr:sulfotransferase [Actinomycetota bacterium]
MDRTFRVPEDGKPDVSRPAAVLPLPRRLNGMTGRLPVTPAIPEQARARLADFIIIGAMKAGTSSLASYLASHPDVFVTNPKEPDFFIAGANWERGLHWYAQLFTQAKEGALLGEASTSYTKHPICTGAPARIRATVPDARLIYLLRDPIDRVVSHYRHELLRGRETRPLITALDQDERYLAPSRYGAQLERYLDHFDSSQLLVLYSEDLLDRREETVRKALIHIGADPDRAHHDFDWTAHTTAQARAPLPPLARLQSTSLYRALTRLVSERIKARARRWTQRRISDFDPKLWELDEETISRLRGELAAELGPVREVGGPTPWSWAEGE